ncbi:Aromatic/aminoadipate aminotransferase 1 [Fusarium torreyae]|uniref:Aromatic/aminoadipate aminotransferase 1 n=1 Tax=Fusarium torreyae TaxID=1237075 RepID=A0A9W8RVC0_9HYPO|nr:Aromatic/aminoadipate aminotransferase 1 [Fusarium torreyae]
MLRRLTLDDLAAIRKQSQPLTGGIAPTTSSALFKTQRCSQKPRSKNFGHRLNDESRLREAATLKAAGAELSNRVLSLATGRPSPEYFPLLDLSFNFYQPGEFGTKRRRGEQMKGHHGDRDLSVEIPASLSYGYAGGSETLVRFLTEHIEAIHDPPYSNWEVFLNIGSTSAIEHAFRMFCTRGDHILVEEYTYSGTLEAMTPLGLRTATVKMDEQGISATDLDSVLSHWNESERSSAKPFLLYTIPTGHNPTGVTQTFQRRKDVYQVAEKHNLLVIEDDPYYYLQFTTQEAIRESQSSQHSSDLDGYIGSLLPSYLSLDVSGRVIRLDSTSKTLGPGLRCSWMTTNSDIASKILNHHDVGVVCPSGLSQLAMSHLLEDKWGHRGFTQWLVYLRDEYKNRRDTLIKACKKHLPLDICSWQAPAAGMFLWIKLDWRQHSLATNSHAKSLWSTFTAIEDSVYRGALKKGTLCCKGSAFSASNETPENMFLRATFASTSLEELDIAVRRVGEALREEFY